MHYSTFIYLECLGVLFKLIKEEHIEQMEVDKKNQNTLTQSSMISLRQISIKSIEKRSIGYSMFMKIYTFITDCDFIHLCLNHGAPSIIR